MKKAVKNAITAATQSVNVVKIYTRKGDRGKTKLLNSKEVSKSDPLIEAEGTIDELSSLIGLTIAFLKDKKDKQLFSSIQKDLYQLMAILAGSKRPITFISVKIKGFEQYIDKTSLKLPKLNGFLLPQGGIENSLFHLTRTVCRRAERRVVFLLQKKPLPLKIKKKNLLMVIKYLNRFGDFLFIMARKYASREITAKSNCK